MHRNRIITGILIGAAGLAAAAVPAAAWQQVPPVPGPGDVPPRGAAIEDIRPHEPAALRGLAVPVVPPLADREVAGLPEQVPAELLTWQRVYALALVRARAGGSPPLAGSLDPAALAEQARRLGVDDFARFRGEFLAGPTDRGDRFHDPADTYLAILRRVQKVAHARQQIARLENLISLIQELVKGRSSGLSQLDLDIVTRELTEARSRSSRRVAEYRNALDELKTVLGLSPRAAIVADRSSLAAFDRVFEQVDQWNRRPDRNLTDLPRIVQQFPALGEVIINGRRMPPQVAPSVAWLDGILKEATDQAGRNHAASGRKDSDRAVALELRVRRRVRRLIDLRDEYENAKQMYVLSIRLGDQAFERMLAPSSPATALTRGPSVQAVVDTFGRSLEAQDRLITVWTGFHAERLELYRDLGSLPYGNWDVFYASFAASTPVRPAPAPVLEPAAAPPPAPPAPAVEP